jgi:hypothetical protein
MMTVGVTANDMLIHLLHAMLSPARQSRHFEFLRLPYTIGLLGGQAFLAAGLSVPAIASLGTLIIDRYDRWTEADYARRMSTLHRRMVSEFPQIMHQLPLTFDVMSIEITDGVSLLAQYVTVADRDRAGSDAGVRDPAAAAALLYAALDARRGGEQPILDEDGPRLEPDFGGKWRPRAKWMAGVARALDRWEESPKLARALREQ